MTDQKLFGTDGVRGVANEHPMTADVALKLGKALGKVFKNTQDIRTVLIGKDTRLSGYLFETALTSGICSMGLDVFLVGPLPTPAVAHLTKSLNANAGIMISASHNPACDNGIKIFNEKGVKLSDLKEQEIEAAYFSADTDDERAAPDEIGKAFRMDHAQGRYIEFAKSTVGYRDLSGLKVVVDCANGAAYAVGPRIFDELGVDLTVLNDEPDGMNINENCGALHPEAVADQVKALGADIGIALDGDSDRIILADENGAVVDGDQILALAALHMKQSGQLANDSVVITVMSNIGLKQLLKENDIDMVTTGVGDRYVIEEMVKGGYNLGGEQSGHIIFSDHNLTGDAIISGLQVLSIMKETGKPLSELVSVMQKAPQTLINLAVREKKPFEAMPSVQEAISEAEKNLGDNGRLLVRYSGTEPIARVLVESMDGDLAASEAARIADSIRAVVGT
jgi:phosphoglucosamine mutase